jgi:hypothetical protein
MAAGNWIVFDSAKELIGGGLNLASATIKMMLLTDSYTPNRATQVDYADISANECANGGGYTTGGATLASKSYDQTGGVATFTADPVTWTGSGAGIADVHKAVLYIDDGADDALLAYCILETGGEFTVEDGQELTVTPHSSGILSLAGATS